MLKPPSDAPASESPSKGPRTNGGKGGNDGNDGNSGSASSNTITVSKSELSHLLDTKFETAAQRSESHIDTSIKQLRDEIDIMDKKHDTKHDETATRMAALETKINAAVESFTNIAATNASTLHDAAEAAVLSARASTPHGVGNLPFAFQPPPEDPYHRAPLPARLKLFAADPITLTSATQGAKAMCDQAGIKESDYTVTPLGNPGLARLFAIDFVGTDEPLNILRAKKARDCLRNPDGKWLEVMVPAAAGDTRAYINVDKSPKVERVEKLSKLLLKVCQQEFSDKKFFLGRATGTIKCGWTPIAVDVAPTPLKFHSSGTTEVLPKWELLKMCSKTLSTLPRVVQPTWSGLFNKLVNFAPFNGTSFSIGTWNTRVLLCSNRQQRNKKLGSSNQFWVMRLFLVYRILTAILPKSVRFYLI